jgi:hypothetical protein
MTHIATFHTHYGAMKFWRDCGERGIAAEPMPVPRALSASCGTCVRFEAGPDRMPAEPYDLDGYYSIHEDGGYRAVEP